MEPTVSEQVVEKVARVTGTDALELPPLYDSVDPDALDSLATGPGDVEIAFVYAGQEVCVESGGEISVGECSDPPVANELPADD